jgi:hypothetical protein
MLCQLIWLALLVFLISISEFIGARKGLIMCSGGIRWSFKHPVHEIAYFALLAFVCFQSLSVMRIVFVKSTEPSTNAEVLQGLFFGDVYEHYWHNELFESDDSDKEMKNHVNQFDTELVPVQIQERGAVSAILRSRLEPLAVVKEQKDTKISRACTQKPKLNPSRRHSAIRNGSSFESSSS